MVSQEIKERVKNDPDFINSKRFDYSLKKCIERYPDGAPARVVAAALCMTEEEVEAVYTGVLLKLRETMKVEDYE